MGWGPDHACQSSRAGESGEEEAVRVCLLCAYVPISRFRAIRDSPTWCRRAREVSHRDEN